MDQLQIQKIQKAHESGEMQISATLEIKLNYREPAADFPEAMMRDVRQNNINCIVGSWICNKENLSKLLSVIFSDQT